MKLKFLIFGIFCTLILSIFSCKNNKAEEKAPDDGFAEWTDSLQHIYAYGICIDSLDIRTQMIRNGDNPAIILSSLGFSPGKADSIFRCSANILDPKKLKAGLNYYIFATTDSLNAIRYIIFTKSQTEYAVIDLSSDSIRAYAYNKPITLKRKFVQGTITSSLWNAIREAGADPLLAMKLADVFAWQIDFFDVKKGDSFMALYNEAYIDDSTALYIASIEGAIFNHQSKTFEAIPFGTDTVGYYDKEGQSIRKAFLKAPLDFFRITSRFSNSRYHPVLKRYRAHHGVDYAAPTGTPVKCIGDGVVIKKAYQANGGGNYLVVKHNATYTTTYMHLSRFGAGIQVGSHVKQGQEIAYVGSTGLSTGPHLDFRVHKNGVAINPLDMEAPATEPVQTAQLDSFKLIRDQLLLELDSCQRVLAASVRCDSSALADALPAPKNRHETKEARTNEL